MMSTLSTTTPQSNVPTTTNGPASRPHHFAASGLLVRLYARVDRVKQSAWMLGLFALIALNGIQLKNVVSSEMESTGLSQREVLASQATIMETNPSIVALSGPADALDTFGGRYAFELGAFALAIVGVMNVFLVARHTRTDEETGRAELLRAGRVGLWAPLTATAAWAAITNAALGGFIAIMFAVLGEAVGSCIWFGLSYTLCGLCFAALTMVWSQVFDYGRQVIGAGVATVAFAYAIRGVGDVQGSWLSWLSPIGIAQQLDAFGASRHVALIALAIIIIAAITAAWALTSRRDVGRGLIASRDGAFHADDSLCSPMGLMWRLQRTSLVAWTVGLGALGAMYGSIIGTAEEFATSSEAVREMMERMGMSLTNVRDGFATALLTQLALVASGGCLALLLRVRSQETSGRAEPVLAAAVSRTRWSGAYVALAVVAAPLMMTVIGSAFYLTDAVITGEVVGFGRGLAAALVRVPAIWLLTAIGFALYGIGARWGLAVWGVLFVTFQWTLLVNVLNMPDWTANLNPFSHLDHLPLTDQSLGAPIVITLVAAAFFAVGFALLNRRDIG